MIYIILLIALWVWGVTPSTVILCGILSLLWHHGTPPTPPAKAVTPLAGAGATDSHPQSPHTVLDYSGWTRDSIDTIRDASTPHEYQPPLPYQQSGVA